MSAIRRPLAVCLFLFLAACEGPPGPERLELTQVGYADLPGWPDDAHGEAAGALARSCARFLPQPDDRAVGPNGLGGTIAEWRALCVALAAVPAGDGDAARRFFETWFVPFRTGDGRGGEESLFTGYYEPLLNGARQRGGSYTVPIYARPDDLVVVNLGKFHADLKGRSIVGRITKGTLTPYDDRGRIDGGSLDGRVRALAWVDNPVDAFFLHIQGSGRIRLPGGEVMRVGYAARNGHPYVSIGRILVARGVMELHQASMQSIRAWVAANPEEGAALLAENPSYIFFRELAGEEGPIGSQGAPLTAGRSVAVDRRHIPLGVPLWLDIAAPAVERGSPDVVMRRLVIAQDTGGAIKGPLRGDFFWGFGAEATSRAGRMKHRGRIYVLLPRAAVERGAHEAGPV
jgi:membrane-bound lytic murein transglycosylase A